MNNILKLFKKIYHFISGYSTDGYNPKHEVSTNINGKKKKIVKVEETDDEWKFYYK